ncbi:hypothetical protein LCI18_002579 [Fusarium solani-melongenae]|uniref:Uncharacterized protein n=1 Tax=Fusarium solani subsp. cucurbitae TaxID=2747967 RepID=A0ACD3YRS7_FUSSC|nr:hypothetical protein LCI18_002579 [Fusarium solani-melongenae]
MTAQPTAEEMAKARKRNPSRKKESRLLQEIFRPGFIEDLNRYLKPRKRLNTGHPAHAQASASRPAGSTRNVNTPSYSTIASTTPSSFGFPGALPTETYHPPEASGQALLSPGSNLYPLDTTTGYHAQHPTPDTFTTMDPNNIDGYNYQPCDYTQDTPNTGLGTIDTWAQPSSLSTGVWSTQGQYNMNRSSVQTPSNTNTFSQQAEEQQLLPIFDLSSVRVWSFWIRRPNYQWISIDVYDNPNMRRSYLTRDAAMGVGWSQRELMTFPPGNHGRDWTRDGGLAPTYWVTADIAGDGLVDFPETTEHFGIYPLPQYPGTTAGLIMGSDLRRKLFPQQGGGTVHASQSFNN